MRELSSSAYRAALAKAQLNYAKIHPNFSADNLLAVRDKFLPPGGVWIIGGTPTTPGVNATFGLGISPADLDNLRRGLTLYSFAPAHISAAKGAHSYSMAGTAYHARAYPTPFVNDYFRARPSTSLYDINSALSRATQSDEQQQNRAGNINALEGIAIFATAGYLAYAAPAAGAAGGAADTGGAGLTTGVATQGEIDGTLTNLGASGASGGLADAGGAGFDYLGAAEGGATAIGKSLVIGKLEQAIAPKQQDTSTISAPVSAVNNSGQNSGLQLPPAPVMFAGLAALLVMIFGS